MILNHNKTKRGFTLIELLVVISIIALLSSVVMTAVASAREKAIYSQVRSEMAEFVKALEIYKTTYGVYPSCSKTVCLSSISNGIYSPATGFFEFKEITDELNNKKIYQGDLTKTLLKLPNIKNLLINYTMTPSVLALRSPLWTCGDSTFSDYNITIRTNSTAGGTYSSQ